MFSDTNQQLRKLSIYKPMQTTTATYIVYVTPDDENIITFYKTMPTKPKTSKGIKSQNDKLSKWVEKEYPNFTSYEISPTF